MKRIDQAMRWWKNHEKNNRIFSDVIPDRHKTVLLKMKKIQLNYGITSASDYYTLSSKERIA